MALIALLEFITNLDQMLSPVCEVWMWLNTRAKKASPDKLLFFWKMKKNTCSVVDDMGSVTLDGGEFKMLPLCLCFINP